MKWFYLFEMDNHLIGLKRKANASNAASDWIAFFNAFRRANPSMIETRLIKEDAQDRMKDIFENNFPKATVRSY